MAITNPDTRQYPLVAIASFTQADLASGVGAPAIQLPQGAIVTGGQLIVDTAFDSVTSDTGEVGDASSANRYLSGVNMKTAGATDLVPTGFETTDTEPNIVIENTAVGTEGTAGVGRLIVEYIVNGRGNENQG